MKILYFLGIAGLFISWYLTNPCVGYAQVAADGTLPTNVVSPDGLQFTITGGSQVGNNLFHSFSQLSLPTGASAIFNNALDVQNIISRVTGGFPSNIDGMIQANGSANLFLINPNGIIFGPNAQLNIGGSFFATTANSLKFADGTELNTSSSQTPPLLTVSVPVGLQYGQPGAIAVQGSHLSVQPSQTLALIGGEVALSGGTLSAESGRVELGGVAGAGTVGLTATGSQYQFIFPKDLAKANVLLTNNALVTTSGDGGGNIQLTGQQLTIQDSRVEANTLGSISGANLILHASNSVVISSASTTGTFESGLFAENSGNGASEGIAIATNKLLVEGEARISTATSVNSSGAGGNITVNASDATELFGVDSPDFSLFTGLLTDTQGSGVGGDLTVNTGQLIIHNGAQLTTATSGNAQGGNLIVNARDTVELIGVSPSDLLASGLFSAVQTGSGNAGTLTVNTGRLIIREGAQIFAGTITTSEGNGGNIVINASDFVNIGGVSPIYKIPSGVFSNTNPDTLGNAGNLTINTKQLIIKDGANIAVDTFGFGKGGVLAINATDSVQLLGQGPLSENPLDPNELIPTFSSLSASVLNPDNTQDATSISINTEKLLVQEGARISVDNRGLGKGGNINIQARSILLNNAGNSQENAGGIQATTGSGEGGNITLQVKDLLLMLNGSKISTDATGGSSNGGNITITSSILGAFNNSDITANAILGRGGNVQIVTQGIFGTQFRPALTPESDITATSGFGLSGVVDIKTPNIDPTKGIINLPEQLTDVSTLISQSCGGRGKSGSFTITGRGGLRQSPEGALSSDIVLQDIDTMPVQLSSSPKITLASTKIAQSAPNEIIEAQGLAVNSRGEVFLIAQAPDITPHSRWLTSPSCHSHSR
ncbi:hypothetical protein WA1_14820 [Scytonema hofmannii PCC 7110]|uniref:Filamentous haemagglutinin FhaB/tRNA nuclease CdiA-like TPS domain-containing protein n=1 Tax=Scytonema hofmannii PCC 7110 TaxID=128403 RepID=A0A139XD51_9CYAN|nr:filamentous hemagglutinin N-terminal domain-containing protein [Scytonema hofmannii]KYC42618.1 hypothetical protein WA1_14820 [Scytonema hofmannii PCC 7110]